MFRVVTMQKLFRWRCVDLEQRAYSCVCSTKELQIKSGWIS